MTQIDFDGVSTQRQIESKCLYDSKHFHSAIYLLGYALECAFKARIRKEGKDVPAVHDFEALGNVLELDYRQLAYSFLSSTQKFTFTLNTGKNYIVTHIGELVIRIWILETLMNWVTGILFREYS